MKGLGRDVLGVIGWSAFWVAVILGVAGIWLEWGMLQRIF
jgi:hypothetical protein